MVLGILALGSTCFIISLVRLPILVAATLDSNPALEGTLSLFFCILEASIGVISACLPGLAPLVKHWYQASKASSGSRHYDHSDRNDQGQRMCPFGVQSTKDIQGSYIPMDDYPSSLHDTTPLSPKLVQ
ncbi:hypothetical protein VTN77DRAFT_4695 [Rasamsonia byssochlamydoides]|uniref:uncharacterized protein n=1 Tax=Rasamsonia byssochlamydoides TaxID=89139 RepID=UPI0037424F7D